MFFAPAGGAEVLLGNGKQPVAAGRGAEMFVLWQQGNDLVSATGAGQGEPTKRAADARFAVVVNLSGNRGTVFAYEQGSVKEKQPGIVVERL